MPKRTFSVLAIDASEDDYEASRRELYSSSKEDRFNFTLEWRKTLAHGVKAIADNTYDAILVDLNLPDMQGPDVFHAVHAVSSDIPIVVLTGIDSELITFKLIEAGAQDFIVKGKFAGALFRSLVNAIIRHESVRKLEISERNTRSSALAKNAFFANMSHEIRNPLTSVIGYSEALMGSALEPKEQHKALSAVFANGKHLLQLINDILDLSKIEANEMKIEASQESFAPFLRDLKQAFAQMAQKKGLVFSVHVDAPLPVKLEVDFFRLRQILYNIIGNAIKFTREGFVKLNVKAEPTLDTLVFEIKDSGVGISESGKKKLFTAFSQAEPGRAKEFGGTGLGLAISRRLLERMSGSLECQSREGIGSVFTITVPLGQTGLSTLSELPPNLDEVARGNTVTNAIRIAGRVLVADDLEDNRDLISLLLRKVGVTVETAADGAEACAKALEAKFDLILLDMEMPKMSGQEVVRTLRSRGFSTPVVAITAMMLEDSLRECLEAGCDACLPKPFSQEDLYGCLLKFLGEDSIGRPAASAQPSVQHDQLAKVRLNFLKRLPARLDEIENALESKDLLRLRGEAHRLIGAGLFGFQDLSHFGGTLESLVIQEQMGGLGLIEALVKKVRGEVSRIAVKGPIESTGEPGDTPVNISDSSTVLVLDDDDVNLKVVCRILNVKGFLAAPARNSQEALGICDADDAISLLIIALETGRTDNFELIPAIRRKLKRNIPVIAMTSLLPSEVRSRLTELDVQYLLEKPVSRDQLLSTIDTLITANLAG